MSKIWELTRKPVKVIGQSKQYPDCMECIHEGKTEHILKTEIIENDGD